MPCFVCTLEPSTIGSRSRCTPSRETSGPPVAGPRWPAILSISSRKMIPIGGEGFQFVARPLVAHFRCIGFARHRSARRDDEEMRSTACRGGGVRRLLDVGRHRQQQVEKPLFYFLFGRVLDFGLPLAAHHV